MRLPVPKHVQSRACQRSSPLAYWEAAGCHTRRYHNYLWFVHLFRGTHIVSHLSLGRHDKIAEICLFFVFWAFLFHKLKNHAKEKCKTGTRSLEKCTIFGYDKDVFCVELKSALGNIRCSGDIKLWMNSNLTRFSRVCFLPLCC